MKKIIAHINLKYICSNYSRKFTLIFLILMASCIWGGIYQSHQDPLPPNPPDYNWMHYFSHNIQQSLFSITVGFITYGIGSFILLFMNGMVIGIVLAMTIQHDMVDTIFTAFLPHAIFELPAMMLAALVPFIIWNFIKESIRNRKIQYTLIKAEVIPSVVSIVILLFIASIMESMFAI
ncbi:stage II sporulation protein M [Bacillus cereus]|uniref:stage II sporulation protein M n=1 Tax=Bacillus cereus TaxID=1396 RepID=UPI0005CE5A49|nr:stage II sporulation protein M [Bacillus cereus]